MSIDTFQVSRGQYNAFDDLLAIAAQEGWDGGGGGSQTPIVQDVDYDGFDIQDISNVEFRDTTGAPGITVPAIWFDMTTENAMVFNVPSTNGYTFKINGANTLEVLANGDLQINAKDIFGIVNLSFEISGIDIHSDSGGLEYLLPSGDTHEFFINSVSILEISSTALTVGASIDLANIDDILFADGHSIVSTIAGFEFITDDSNDRIEFEIPDNNEIMTIRNTEVDLFVDLDLSSGAEIDYGASGSPPAGAITGSIPVKVLGVAKSLAFYG